MNPHSVERSRVDRRKAEKRASIIDAAVDVFAERGFHPARVSDIARRAGVADGTIYLYFKNKEDLLLSIFEEKMDILLAAMHGAMETTNDPVQRVRLFAINHFKQVEQNRAAAEVLQVELRLSNKFLKEYRPEKLWAYLDIFASTVRQGQTEGVFRAEIDPFIAMWSFFGGLDEIAMQWVLARDRQRIPLEQAAHQVADIFVRGMLAESQPTDLKQPEET